MDHELKEDEIKDINNNMNGFSAADIVQLLRESLVKTLIEDGK